MTTSISGEHAEATNNARVLVVDSLVRRAEPHIASPFSSRVLSNVRVVPISGTVAD
jgi:hypothetical protein